MSNDWIGLIPAAGQGLRLSLPYPKELYPIIRENRYRPISQYVLNCLTAAGLAHAVFVINETKHQLLAYFGDGHRFGCNLSFVVQESHSETSRSSSPGLAHALDSAYHLTVGKTVFFGMPDTIMQPERVFALAYESMTPQTDVLLILFSTKTPEKFGMVRIKEGNIVTRIDDKPRETNLTKMWGAIIWRPSFTEHLHDCVHQTGISDFAEVMNTAIAKGLLFGGFHVRDGIYSDLGTYEEILELDRRFREV